MNVWNIKKKKKKMNTDKREIGGMDGSENFDKNYLTFLLQIISFKFWRCKILPSVWCFKG